MFRETYRNGPALRSSVIFHREYRPARRAATRDAPRRPPRLRFRKRDTVTAPHAPDRSARPRRHRARRGNRSAAIDPLHKIGLARPDHLVLAEDDPDAQTRLGRAWWIRLHIADVTERTRPIKRRGNARRRCTAGASAGAGAGEPVVEAAHRVIWSAGPRWTADPCPSALLSEVPHTTATRSRAAPARRTAV